MTSVIATVSFVLCSASLFDAFCLVSSFDVLFSRKNVIYDTILSLGFVLIYISACSIEEEAVFGISLFLFHIHSSISVLSLPLADRVYLERELTFWCRDPGFSVCKFVHSLR